jgi:hypothetical protein
VLFLLNVNGRFLNCAALASTGLLVFILAISIFPPNPRDHHVSLKSNFHIGVWRRDSALGSLVFFNNGQWGPYSGSIMFIHSNGSVLEPTSIGWGKSWGVYYRHFQWKNGDTLWTLAVSLWYPFLLFALLPVLRIARLWGPAVDKWFLSKVKASPAKR